MSRKFNYSNCSNHKNVIDLGVCEGTHLILSFRRTVDMVRQLESAGISFLSVHGRTIRERNESVHLDIVRTIVDSVSIPVIANGDIDSIEKGLAVQEATGVKGNVVNFFINLNIFVLVCMTTQ